MADWTYWLDFYAPFACQTFQRSTVILLLFIASFSMAAILLYFQRTRTTVLLYVKPRTQKWVIKNMFEEIMHEIFLFQNILIIGDFNIDYEQNYDFIENLAEAHNLNVGPNTDTTLNSTCIDYCFSRQTVSINTHFIQWS